MRGYTSIITRDVETATRKINSSIYIKETTSYSLISQDEINNTIFLKIDSKKLFIVVTYLRPGQRDMNESVLIKISENIQEFCENNSDYCIIMVGDMNQENDSLGLHIKTILQEQEYSPDSHIVRRNDEVIRRNKLVKIFSKNVNIESKVQEQLFQLSDHAGILIKPRGNRFKIPLVRTELPNKRIAERIRNFIENGTPWATIQTLIYSNENRLRHRVSTNCNR